MTSQEVVSYLIEAADELVPLCITWLMFDMFITGHYIIIHFKLHVYAQAWHHAYKITTHFCFYYQFKFLQSYCVNDLDLKQHSVVYSLDIILWRINECIIYELIIQTLKHLFSFIIIHSIIRPYRMPEVKVTDNHNFVVFMIYL